MNYRKLATHATGQSLAMPLDALDLMAGLVLEDGRRWGDAAAAFQWEDAQAILGGGEAPFHYLTRARGGSKTTDLAGMAAALLLTLPPRTPLDWLAADQEQGQLAVEAIGGFASRVAFVDELAQWGTTAAPRRLWEAVSSGVAKRSDAQMVVLTTAGAPGHWAYQVLKHAEGDRMWRVHEVPGPAPWMDEGRVEEQQRRLPESSFRRLFMNEWTEPEDRLTTKDDLEACVTLDGPLDPVRGVKYLVGLDLGLKRDRTVGVICHRDGDTVVLDRMAVWQGTRRDPVEIQAVEDWVSEAHRTFNGASVVLDPWQAVSMAQRLRGSGVRVTEHVFTPQSNANVALTLHRLLRDRALALPDDEELLDELANVKLRETSPGVYRLDHDQSAHDDRAVALGLAAFYLTQQPRAIDHAALAVGLAAANNSLSGRSIASL